MIFRSQPPDRASICRFPPLQREILPFHDTTATVSVGTRAGLFKILSVREFWLSAEILLCPEDIRLLMSQPPFRNPAP